MSIRKELDAPLVRTLCAGIAARENIMLQPKSSENTKAKITSVLNTQKKECRWTRATSLEDILLNDMSLKERNKLMKRIPLILKELRTTDVDTARSFLGLEQYSDIRWRLISELNEFATVDLKMDVVTTN